MLRRGGKREQASTQAEGARGYIRCAVARGSVRFAHPAGWRVFCTGGSVIVADAEPPGETRSIEVSALDLPPLSATGLTLAQFVRRAARADHSGADPADLRELRRDGLEIVWSERTRNSVTPSLTIRTAWCYGNGVYAVFAYGFRPNDRASSEAIWDVLLRSIELGPAPNAQDAVVRG